MSEKNNLYMVKAMYLGSEPMGELLEGENGSDAIQVPLKRTILRTDNTGEEVELSMTNDSLVVNFLNPKHHNHHHQEATKRLVLPIDLLAYCGALRQLPSSRIKEREFETLDKSPPVNTNDPPLFVTIFRNFEQENTLYCHSFIIRKDEEAMELVKLVMEIYYNLIRLQELDETSYHDQDDNFSIKSLSSVYQSDSVKNLNMDGLSITKESEKPQRESGMSDYNSLLDIYNKLPTNKDQANESNSNAKSNNQTYPTYSNPDEIYNRAKDNYEIVSANDILNKEYMKLTNKENEAVTEAEMEEINRDPNPIVIKKKNEENIEYKQNVFIRWLQPPTPPPPAPIIIREVQEETLEEPPLIIYKQAPRAVTPPPLIIRERPPSPLNQPTEPFVIEKRVPANRNQQRKIIIEHLPAPPPKPRDIILEKWLPREVGTERSVYYQKLNNKNQSNTIDPNQYRSVSYRSNDIKQIGDMPSSAKSSLTNFRKVNPKIYSHLEDQQFQLNNKDIYYPSSTSSKKSQKVAGYRIIRQIIPGPNSTAAEIEKALERSKHVSTTSFTRNQPSRIYSPSFDAQNIFNNPNVYSGSNLNVPGVYSSSGTIYNSSQGALNNNHLIQKGSQSMVYQVVSNKSYSSHTDMLTNNGMHKRVNSVDKL